MSHKILFAFALVCALSFLAQRGVAQNRSVHEGEWPIENGVKHQPTRGDLGRGREFSQDQAREMINCTINSCPPVTRANPTSNVRANPNRDAETIRTAKSYFCALSTPTAKVRFLALLARPKGRP